jgi:hypothetical protein
VRYEVSWGGLKSGLLVKLTETECEAKLRKEEEGVRAMVESDGRL